MLNIKDGELIIESSVALTWKELKLEKLLKVLRIKS